MNRYRRPYTKNDLKCIMQSIKTKESLAVIAEEVNRSTAAVAKTKWVLRKLKNTAHDEWKGFQDKYGFTDIYFEVVEESFNNGDEEEPKVGACTTRPTIEASDLDALFNQLRDALVMYATREAESKVCKKIRRLRKKVRSLKAFKNKAKKTTIAGMLKKGFNFSDK